MSLATCAMPFSRECEHAAPPLTSTTLQTHSSVPLATPFGLARRRLPLPKDWDCNCSGTRNPFHPSTHEPPIASRPRDELSGNSSCQHARHVHDRGIAGVAAEPGVTHQITNTWPMDGMSLPYNVPRSVSCSNSTCMGHGPGHCHCCVRSEVVRSDVRRDDNCNKSHAVWRYNDSLADTIGLRCRTCNLRLMEWYEWASEAVTAMTNDSEQPRYELIELRRCSDGGTLAWSNDIVSRQVAVLGRT